MNRLVFIITTILMTGMSAQAVAGDPAAGQVKAQACAACHGADGNSANSGFPSLAGQVSGYIAGQLASPKPTSTPAMGFQPDEATLASLAVVPRPSSRAGTPDPGIPAGAYQAPGG